MAQWEWVHIKSSGHYLRKDGEAVIYASRGGSTDENRVEIARILNSRDQLVEALENALNGIDAVLVDVRAAQRRGNIDPGLEAAEYNLSHLTNDVVAALAAARGEGE